MEQSKWHGEALQRLHQMEGALPWGMPACQLVNTMRLATSETLTSLHINVKNKRLFLKIQSVMSAIPNVMGWTIVITTVVTTSWHIASPLEDQVEIIVEVPTYDVVVIH